MLFADYKLQVLDRVTDYYFRNVEKSRRRPRRPASSWSRRSSRSATATATCRTTRTSPRACRSSTSRMSCKSRVEPVRDEGVAEARPVVGRARRLEAVLDSQASAQIRERQTSSRRRATGSPASRSRTIPASATFADRDGRPRRPRLLPARARAKGPKRRRRRTSGWCSTCALRPHTAYRFSCWVKTQGPRPDRLVSAAGARRRASRAGQLTFQEGRARAEPGLEADRRRLQQPRPEGGEPLRRASGARAKARSGSTTCSSRSWRWSMSCGARGARSPSSRPTAGRPTRKAATSSRWSIPSSAQVPWAGEYEFDHPGATIRITPRLADQERRPAAA